MENCPIIAGIEAYIHIYHFPWLVAVILYTDNLLRKEILYQFGATKMRWYYCFWSIENLEMVPNKKNQSCLTAITSIQTTILDSFLSTLPFWHLHHLLSKLFLFLETFKKIINKINRLIVFSSKIDMISKVWFSLPSFLLSHQYKFWTTTNLYMEGDWNKSIWNLDMGMIKYLKPSTEFLKSCNLWCGRIKSAALLLESRFLFFLFQLFQYF